MHRLALSLLLLALAATPAHAAPAAFFGGDPVDTGPEIVSLGDVDVARDGSGAAVYLKRDGGVEHVFAVRLVNGVWQAPERLDPALADASSSPVVAASDGARIAVAFVNAGQLYTVVRPGGQPWGAATAVPGGAPAATADIDMSINGVGYVTWAGGGDVHAARLDRTGATFAPLAAPLDIDPAAVAGDGDGRPRIAVSADGVALVVWGEAGHVYARRLFEMRSSTVPQRVDVDALNGTPGGPAGDPEVDAEDDSSFAWVAVRQAFAGGTRVLARRLRGSLFDDPVDVGGGALGGESASAPRIELNGRGEGMVGSIGSTGTPFVDVLRRDVFASPFALGDPSGVPALPTPAMAEGGDGVMAWLAGAGDAVTVLARPFHDGVAGPPATLARPELGGVDAGAGFDAVANRAGDVVVAFVQGTGAGRSLVVATYDRSPGAFVGNTSQNWHAAAQPKLSWARSFELWGPPSYTVMVDGKPAGSTTAASLTLPAAVPDGEHRCYVVAADRRGQRTRTKSRLLRVDATAPLAALRIQGTRKAGRTLTLFSGASDATSGVRSVVFDFGDRTAPVAVKGTAVKHSFRRGTFTVRVTVTDRAGNETVATKRVQVAKAKKH